MKNTLIIALVAIGLGFAVGWLAKPETAASEDTETAPRTTSRKDKPSGSQRSSDSDNAKPTRSPRRSGVTTRIINPEEMDPETKKRIEESQSRQTEMMKKRLGDKFDMQITAMVKELGLNAYQEKALRAFYA
ncbi:MAG: hypothetical protein QNK86_07285, partial [Akkermansiaceae bacterium]